MCWENITILWIIADISERERKSTYKQTRACAIQHTHIHNHTLKNKIIIKQSNYIRKLNNDAAK